MTFITYLIALIGSQIAYILVANGVYEKVEKKEIDGISSYISKYSAIYMQLIYCFTSFIQLFPQVGIFLGHLERIEELGAILSVNPPKPVGKWGEEKEKERF